MKDLFQDFSENSQTGEQHEFRGVHVDSVKILYC